MGIAQYTYNRSTSGGEIIRELINSTDGQGLHFDGATGQVTATALTLPAPYSFEVIFSADDDVTTGQILIGNAESSSARRALELNSGELRFSYYNGSSWVSVSGGSIEAGKPYHVVATRDSSDVQKIYVNGNDVTSGTNAVSTYANTAFTLSYTNNASYPHRLTGVLYRARVWNKSLSSTEVTDAYENATVSFGDQYGSQTNKIAASVDQDWGTAQADTGNDVTDRATFDTNYVWAINGAPTDISVASNVLQYTTGGANAGIYYPGVLTGNKKYRVTLKTGTITGAGFKVMQYDGSSLNDIGTLVASTTNIFEFTADATTNSNLLVYSVGSGTLQLDASSVDNELVEIGCVADYDLAFANPTQSLTVQDRAGAADGTASATGISQVTKIPQLNATAARIGTTAATPADGAIIANALTLEDAEPRLTFTDLTNNADSLIQVSNNGEILICSDVNAERASSYISFRVDGSGLGNEKMRIDSSGNITTGGGGVFVTTNNVQLNNGYALKWEASGTSITGSSSAVTVAGGGIVETNGVLKENLLTNSGFDVWSNSTLVDASTGAASVQTGADSALTTGGSLVVNGGFDSATTGWVDAFNASLANVSGGQTGNCLEITRSGGSYQTARASADIATVVGKLYELSIWVKSGTSGNETFNAGYYDGSTDITLITGTSSGSWVQYTAVFEATVTTTKPVLKKMTSTAGTMLFDTVTLNEVTPGCVAADALAFDGWFKSASAELYREQNHATYSKNGSFYSLKTVAGAATTEYIYSQSDKLDWRERWAGRTVTIGFWVYSKDAADNVKPAIYDGSWNLGSSFAGSNAWEWMEFTHTMSASATGAGFGFVLDGDSSDVAYISQPMLVFGSAIGSGNYSRPSGEIVWFENRVNSNNVYAAGFSDVAVTTLNAEADSNGAIPKGAKAISAQFQANDSGSAATQSFLLTRKDATASLSGFLVRTYGKTNDAATEQTGWQPCDSNGDYQYQIEASGSGTFDGYIIYNGVQLR